MIKGISAPEMARFFYAAQEKNNMGSHVTFSAEIRLLI